jgi:hypothetical protein
LLLIAVAGTDGAVDPILDALGAWAMSEGLTIVVADARDPAGPPCEGGHEGEVGWRTAAPSPADVGLLQAVGWPPLATAAALRGCLPGPAPAADRPGTVVAGVAAADVHAIEAALERRFDRVVDASDAAAFATLRALCLEQRDWSRVGVFGAGSGGFEWSVGSALHAGHVPLRGLVLSSVQAAVMVFAGAGLGRRSRVVWVPFIAAGIKALSPAGARLRPMLAIAIQGMLFGGAARVLGWNALGLFAGGALVGAWAAAQGLILQYLLIGHDLLVAYETVVGWVRTRWAIGVPGIATVLAAWIGTWGMASGSVALLAWRRGSLPPRLRRALEHGATGIRWEEPAPTWAAAVRRGARDLTRPVFWLPIGVVVAIVLSAGAPWERAFWIAARALTMGIVLFSLAGALDVRGLVAWLRRRGHWGPAVALERAMRR